MPLISIITAAYAPSADFISETGNSIQSLELPENWELEWIVQEDGEDPKLADLLSEFDFCAYDANRRRLGTAGTRNLGLTRARGALMQALDQDDVLLPDAFKILIPHFAEDPTIHWAIGQADDLLPDGSRRAYPSPIQFGLLSPGTVNRWAVDNGGNWPIHCATLMMRTTSFRALGGWAGAPYDDELITFAALSELTPGFYDERLTWLYRHHPKQAHRTELAIALSEAGRRIALQRAAAIRESGIMLPGPAMLGFPDPNIAVLVGPNIKDTTLS